MQYLLPIKYVLSSEENKMSKTKITIAIIEDIFEISESLQILFNEQPDMICKKVYNDAESAITFLSKFPADIVLIDIGLPGMDGISALIELKKVCSYTEFCMFTVFEDNQKIFQSINAGAKGYVLKNSPPSKILSAVRDLANGGSPMNPEIARKVIDAFATHNLADKTQNNLPLTERETELLSLLSKGLLYKEIAATLGITTGTVKQHIHKIYDKLQVNNKTEAINLFLNR